MLARGMPHRYNVGALLALLMQVCGDAKFDAMFGVVRVIPIVLCKTCNDFLYILSLTNSLASCLHTGEHVHSPD